MKDQYAAPGAMVFLEKQGILIVAPLGWILDTRFRKNAYVASLYNRKFSNSEEALASENLMYVMMDLKTKFPMLEDSIKSQEVETRKRLPPETIIRYWNWKSKNDHVFPIRTIYIPGKQSIEITAFAEFESFHSSVVLITPLHYQRVDFPRLIYVAERLFGMEKQEDNGQAKSPELKI